MTKTYHCIIVCLWFCLAGISTSAQDSTVSPCIDISKITYAIPLSRQASSTYIGYNDSLVKVFPSITLQKGMVHTGTIPVRDVAKKGIVQFTLCNPADSAISVWFFPGFFYFDISLYREDAGRLVRVPDVVPEVKDNLGYRGITVQPGDTIKMYAELEMVRTHINTMRPRLIHEDRIDEFIKNIQEQHRDNNMMTFLISGFMMMMIVFSIAFFFHGGNPEFLSYAAYAFFVGGMLFTKALFDLRPNYTGYFLEGYLDYIMQSLGIIFYMFFMRGFLDTHTRHPFLYKLYNVGICLLLLSMIAFSYFDFFTGNFPAQFAVENISKYILLAMTIVFMIYSLRHWNDVLLRYVFWGNFLLFLFSLVSQLMSTFSNVIILRGIWDSSLLYYEFGLLLELGFFLWGLTYKNRRMIINQAMEQQRLRSENQMKEYEKELAVYKAQQEERQRISADMHDELGAGMTAIRLMSEIARNKMKESTPVEIDKISDSADEVLNKMNAIIWSMNSGNDTLDNLVSYIRAYAIEYLENTEVDCRVTTPPEIKPIEITGDKRRNIFLCVKETLNNALKHANASLITIDFTINHTLSIVITDNGKGIDKQNIRQFGNGIKNIARRMENIGGTYDIENRNGTATTGTITTLTLPLNSFG